MTEVLQIESEKDLRKNMRAICQRINDQPELARLLMINPSLVLQDLNVTMTSEVKQHVMQHLSFPQKLIAKRDELKKAFENADCRAGFNANCL